MKHVVIYGGTFDPPTKAHSQIIEQVLRVSNADVWVMPSADRLDKPDATHAEERVAMVELMLDEVFFEERDRVSVSRIEVDTLSPPTKTIQTLTYLQNAYPNHYFQFIAGLDSLADIVNWEDAEILMEEVDWLVVPRPGVMSVTVPDSVEWLPGGILDVSSTKVRGMVSSQKNVEKLVCPQVQSYIKSRGLYVT